MSPDPDAPPTIVRLGNAQVIEFYRDPDDDTVKRRDRIDLQARVTEMQIPSSFTLAEGIAAVQTMWPWHSDTDGPEWVESDDPIIARAVSEQFTSDTHRCVIGRPDGWNEGSDA